MHRRRISLGQSFEVRARQVVQQNVEWLGKQCPQPILQVRFDGTLARMQPVQPAVQPVLVDLFDGHARDVVQGRTWIEAVAQRQLARRSDQPCRAQDECDQMPGHLSIRARHLRREQFVQTQQLPNLMRDEQISEVTRSLPAHAIETDLHHPLARRQLGRIAGKQLKLLLPPITVEDRNDFAPALLDRGIQLAEVGEHPVLRAARRPHRLHQRVVLVGLAILPPWMGLEEHATNLARPPSRWK